MYMGVFQKITLFEFTFSEKTRQGSHLNVLNIKILINPTCTYVKKFPIFFKVKSLKFSQYFRQNLVIFNYRVVRISDVRFIFFAVNFCPIRVLIIIFSLEQYFGDFIWIRFFYPYISSVSIPSMRRKLRFINVWVT